MLGVISFIKKGVSFYFLPGVSKIQVSIKSRFYVLSLRMLTICLTYEALWWLLRAADKVFFSQTAVFLDFRAMVDVPCLRVSAYYYIFISTALDLLLFWLNNFTF